MAWSDGVSVVGKSPNRRVVASRPLRRGDTILREHPALTLLHPSQWKSRCNGCFVKSSSSKCAKLLRCSRCQRFHYCSRPCQRLDWIYHKEECSALSSYRNRKNNDHDNDEAILSDALLVSRVFRLRDRRPEQFQRIMDLVFHQECIKSSHYRIAEMVEDMGLLTMKHPNRKTTSASSKKDIVEMLARFDSNNFGIVDELLFFLGAGIYPAGAMLNHSCHPNCAIIYENNDTLVDNSGTWNQFNIQVIRCLVDVAEGEELCHPYIDFASTAQQRREKLQTTYGFDCQCTRCLATTSSHGGQETSSSPSPSSQKNQWAQSDAWLSSPAPGVKESVAMEAIATSERWLQEAAMLADDILAQELELVQERVNVRSKVLHPNHLSLYQARSQLHTTAMAAGELGLARDQCVQMVKTMETCFYRPEHPLVGVMLYTLGSLHHSLNDFVNAIDCYEKALPILESYHGKHHSFTSGCRDYLQQARQEAG